MDDFLNYNDSKLVLAFSDVIQELFVAKNLTFDIAIYGFVSYRVLDIINEILSKNLFAVKILQLFKNYRKRKRELKNPTVIFCDDLSLVNSFFKYFAINSERQGFPNVFKFLFYYEWRGRTKFVEASKLTNGMGNISWFSYIMKESKSK
jgi:hypothetical protein